MKVNRIFVTGQCSLHWGRLENGNIGNYYIMEPLFRELHRVYKDAEIVTTFQMTKEFVDREKVTILPMDLYYSWSGDDLEHTKKEFIIVKKYAETGTLDKKTPYINELLKADLFIDVSGELWSTYHADAIGKDRFLVGVMKDRIAQLLNIPSIMIASGQGPFSPETFALAKETYEGFDRVYSRESLSPKVVEKYGIDISNTISSICPSFLFESAKNDEIEDVLEEEKVKGTVGVVVCGFNMLQGPYDMKDRPDDDFYIFAEAVEYIVNVLDKNVTLFSHQNGFELPPNFKLINGRDFFIVEQLYKVLKQRNKVDISRVHLISKPYKPYVIKAIIRNFSMLVTGRLHASVAGVTELVPTVIIIYGHGPFAHKTLGFHLITGTDNYIADPRQNNIIEKIQQCASNLDEYNTYLTKKIPQVKQQVHEVFDDLYSFTDSLTSRK